MRRGSLSHLIKIKGAGPRPRSNGANSGPLRKIVSEGENAHGVQTETLECGHTIRRKHDLMGPTNAVRRRCRQCKKELIQ
jgi:hypothetical protein